MRRALAALEKSPWALAALAAAGLTSLSASAFGQLAPPEVVDAAISLGDRQLLLCACAVFVFSLLLSRLALWRRRSPEDEVAAQTEAAPQPGGAHLR